MKRFHDRRAANRSATFQYPQKGLPEHYGKQPTESAIDLLQLLTGFAR